MERLIERGAIRRGGIDYAVQAILANRNGEKQMETIVLSSTHRLAEKVSENSMRRIRKPGRVADEARSAIRLAPALNLRALSLAGIEPTFKV